MNLAIIQALRDSKPLEGYFVFNPTSSATAH